MDDSDLEQGFTKLGISAANAGQAALRLSRILMPAGEPVPAERVRLVAIPAPLQITRLDQRGAR